MNEEQILMTIANYCEDRTLYFQIIIQDDILHVYINRQTDSLDYPKLTAKIYSAIVSLERLELHEVCLYSRILGEIEPDWQTCLEVKTYSETLIESIECLAEEIETAIETTGSLVAELKTKPQISESLTKEIESEMRTTGSLVAKLKHQLETGI